MRKWWLIGFVLLAAGTANAKVHIPDSIMHRDGLYVDNLKIYNDSAIFQGVNLKLDLFNTIYYLCKSQAQMQTYEIALNVRLKQRFYPTLELGYAQGKLGLEESYWDGKGGWASVGLDINGLKKNTNSLNALLVGIRVGTAVQQYDLTGVRVADSYWQDRVQTDFRNLFRTDCWGEVVGGCQVQVYSGLIMGWYLRIKLLFTRKTPENEPYPYYVPGFGYRDDTQWGLSYYIGWKF